MKACILAPFSLTSSCGEITDLGILNCPLIYMQFKWLHFSKRLSLLLSKIPYLFASTRNPSQQLDHARADHGGSTTPARPCSTPLPLTFLLRYPSTSASCSWAARRPPPPAGLQRSWPRGSAALHRSWAAQRPPPPVAATELSSGTSARARPAVLPPAGALHCFSAIWC